MALEKSMYQQLLLFAEKNGFILRKASHLEPKFLNLFTSILSQSPSLLTPEIMLWCLDYIMYLPDMCAQHKREIYRRILTTKGVIMPEIGAIRMLDHDQAKDIVNPNFAALEYACYTDSVELVSKLVMQGVVISAQNGAELVLVIQQHHHKVLDYLIDAKIRINYDCCMALSIFYGNMYAFRRLLTLAEIDNPATIGETTMELAAHLGTPEIITMLLKAGADFSFGNNLIMKTCDDLSNLLILAEAGYPLQVDNERILRIALRGTKNQLIIAHTAGLDICMPVTSVATISNPEIRAYVYKHSVLKSQQALAILSAKSFVESGQPLPAADTIPYEVYHRLNPFYQLKM